MALEDIIAEDAESTPVSHTFTFLRTESGRVVRSDLDADPETPWLLTLGHNSRKVDGYVVQGHLARLDVAVLDADGVTVHPNNIRVVTELRNAVLTEQLCKNLRATLFNALTEAFFIAWCKGSVG